MNLTQLEQEIELHFAVGPAAAKDSAAMTAFLTLRSALEAGEVRAAEPDAATPSGWRVNAWVKRGILLGFRLGVTRRDAPRRQLVYGPFFCRQAHLPRPPLHRRRRCARSSRRLFGPRRSLRLSRRCLHAAHVHQRRRVHRRGHARRFARAGRLLRADRQARSL